MLTLVNIKFKYNNTKMLINGDKFILFMKSENTFSVYSVLYKIRSIKMIAF